jgi:transcriptional regulator with XRE-family HTH domain
VVLLEQFRLTELYYFTTLKRREDMAQFGVKVQELLKAAGKDAAWLATQTGIANSTISNWLSDPKVQPKPSSVEKVAIAFGVDVDDLAGAAGYVIRQSKSNDERSARRDALLASSPRWESALDRLATKPAYHQDVALSMLESYLSTIPPNDP